MVFAAMTLLVDADAATPDVLATDEAATPPDEAGRDTDGVPD